LALTHIFKERDWLEEIWLFVGIAFAPILYFNLMEALAESHLALPTYFYQTKMGRFMYRLSSVLLYILILGIMYNQIG